LGVTPAQIVGFRIQQMRKASGMTQAALGQELKRYLGKGWTKQAVSAAERGLREITIEELFAFAAAFKCSFVNLYAPLPPNVGIDFVSGEQLDSEQSMTMLIGPKRARDAFEQGFRIVGDALAKDVHEHLDSIEVRLRQLHELAVIEGKE
jgi:transcriptional regulator with XRE-family HTH domain